MNFMTKRFAELFISRRISLREGGERNVMVRIATLSVAVSVAVIIIALSVIIGFKEQISRNLSALVADVQVTALYSGSAVENTPITRLPALEERVTTLPLYRSIAPYASRSGIIRSSDAIHGTVLKGVGPEYDLSLIEEALIEGTLPRIGGEERFKDILICQAVADIFGYSVGDRVEIIFVGGDRPVRRDSYQISGIYATGMEELEKLTALTDIRNVQRLNGWQSDQVSGYELRSTSLDEVNTFGEGVYDLTLELASDDEPLRVTSVRTLYPNIFDWLRTHNLNAVVIIVIMLTVALMNMISALLIIVLERTSMIGTLRALGMTTGGVRRIFLMRSARIVGKGLLWGNVVALALLAVQHFTHLITLDPSGYMLAEVPVAQSVWWLVVVDVAVPVAMLLCMIIPVGITARIKPEQTIRYQ